ncbi:Membrane protein-like protein [Alloalcanivorax dieselolei B5]|uniref:Membrane protein-like protein n=1 Tax=Alcanivorax dieselolei (strain DSM 16502 / CGMCC 1.3690 / MCCC 1A00001 / B-5) TaxID=930169 RepID=K0CLU3_ALCDB|nr:DUF2306 domain-containing protein [Alloalcanivorax dieselolei]AFT72616.1 Membrane protein-like protein [Alloalcanivorax dieselolei B5]GGJ79153.1 membrane protein [Alloalcanivorax dieselolei]
MITLHWLAAVLALILGAVQLLTPKGDRRHRKVGWAWVLAMATTAVSSFWIHGFLPIVGPFSPIHLLSVWVLFCLIMAVVAARRRRLRMHRGFTIGAYLGLVGAGLGALAPGRLISGWLF